MKPKPRSRVHYWYWKLTLTIFGYLWRTNRYSLALKWRRLVTRHERFEAPEWI